MVSSDGVYFLQTTGCASRSFSPKRKGCVGREEEGIRE